MEIIGYVITGLVLMLLFFAWIGMWKSNKDKITDYHLYGMDGDEYLKKQVGKKYYNKYYKK